MARERGFVCSRGGQALLVPSLDEKKRFLSTGLILRSEDKRRKGL